MIANSAPTAWADADTSGGRTHHASSSATAAKSDSSTNKPRLKPSGRSEPTASKSWRSRAGGDSSSEATKDPVRPSSKTRGTSATTTITKPADSDSSTPDAGDTAFADSAGDAPAAGKADSVTAISSTRSVKSTAPSATSLAGWNPITVDNSPIKQLSITLMATLEAARRQSDAVESRVTAALASIAAPLNQLLRTLSDSTPTLIYNSSANTPGQDGAVHGQVIGADPDGDTLTYSVRKPPRGGSVVLNSDGTFTYTPDAAMRASGGVDTFTVTVSDARNNPFHLHGIGTLLAADFGHTSSVRVTVLVQPAQAGEINPLATAQQLEFEKRVARIVNSPLVQLAKIALKIAWPLTAQRFFANVNGPDQTNLDQIDAAINSFAAFAAMTSLNRDPYNPKINPNELPQHTWYGVTGLDIRALYDNPDTTYRIIPMSSDSVYVVTGKFINGQMPVDTTFSVLVGTDGKTASTLSASDLDIAPDGSYTITLDSNPTAPGQKNHIQLPSGATGIVVRDTLLDWDTETATQLSVQRVSGPADSVFHELGLTSLPVVGPALQGLGAALARVGVARAGSLPDVYYSAFTAVITVVSGVLWYQQRWAGLTTTDPTTGELRPPNELSQPASAGSDTLATQLQSLGYFQLDDDQTLVVTVDPGNAGYFVVPVTNEWTVTNNYWDHQTSLNNSQAVANPDGTYTFVISKTDPGVANWVSTGGLNQGTLFLRFQALDPNSTDKPSVSAQVVPIDGLVTVLPPTTVYVTPEERAAQIAARQVGFNRRFAPYPQV
ncbi:MAG: Ig-like domain-containing protein [Mycobacterium sp.]